MEFVTYPDAEMMMMNLANRIAGELRQALAVQERVSLAVPGGTTPGPIFDVLSALDLDWDRVDVMLTDERWVPETSERSNTALLRNRLLTGRAQAATLIPLYTATETPEEGLPSLQPALEACLPLTICLLGMGADRHTASIFPGADRLSDALYGDDLMVPMRAPGAPEPRITLSAKVLQSALHRHIVITGEAKREALESARGMSVEEAPVNAVLKGATIHWAKG